MYFWEFFFVDNCTTNANRNPWISLSLRLRKYLLNKRPKQKLLKLLNIFFCLAAKQQEIIKRNKLLKFMKTTRKKTNFFNLYKIINRSSTKLGEIGFTCFRFIYFCHLMRIVCHNITAYWRLNDKICKSKKGKKIRRN